MQKLQFYLLKSLKRFIIDLLGQHRHFDKEYTFTDAGIHIVEVDLYTWKGNVITEKFNISTLNPFGYIFYSMVIIGVLFPASLFVFLLFHKKIKGKNFTV